MTTNTQAAPFPCNVYRCAKREELYLYVKQSQNLKKLPADLLQSLGELELAMSILLHKDKKLARANAEQVVESIEELGYYVQTPPSTAELVEQILAKK